MATDVYMKRIIDTEIIDQLEAMGAVLIEGPKWCGKTRSALEASSSIFYVSRNRNLAADLPDVALAGEAPRLIDEWQLVPKLWDYARLLIDERAETGLFIFTGSSLPDKERPSHSGAGRFARITMRTMSLYESYESTGQVSLKALFDGEPVGVFEADNASIEDIVWALVRGGWPASLNLSRRAAARVPHNYIEAVANADVEFIEDESISWDSVKVKLLMQSLARVSAQSVNLSKTVEDVRSIAGVLTRKTAASYINALKRLFVIEDQPAWSGSLRSKTPLRKSPKRHYTDPSLAAAAIGASEAKLLQDHATLGLLFETLCYRDVSVYAQPLGATISYYKDASGLEIDQVISLADGRWAACEVKLGEQFIDKAAADLVNLSSRINTDLLDMPAFLAILYTGKYAYQRSDGVYVIPITSLGP